LPPDDGFLFNASKDSAPADPLLAGMYGPTSNGREGKVMEREGTEGGKGMEWAKKGIMLRCFWLESKF